ncbi:MAG: DUF1700 domain-containing protein [Oscillospiraceae bacterium]|jgi:uncharacterized membrane protein|nr:DUF1700 domain-containing protein [Oscillospiraceae bacterium]
MTREIYVRRLETLLKKLPPEKRWGITEDINMHFIEGNAAGKSDAALAEGLGAPESLARAYMLEFAADRATRDASVGNVMRMIWAALGVGLVNVIIALPVWLAVVAVWLSLLAAGVSAAVGGVVAAFFSLIDWFVPLPFVNAPMHITAISGGAAIASLGGLTVIGTMYLGKWLLKLLARYLQANRTIIAKRG